MGVTIFYIVCGCFCMFKHPNGSLFQMVSVFLLVRSSEV